MRKSIVLALVAACGGPSRAPEQAPAPEESVLRPAPGADLEGPVAPPVKGERTARAGGDKPLDLGADRPVTPIALPSPPRGGAAGFTFGDDRKGWVARIPEQNQLPSVAYGNGRLYVSGGFESISFYSLDATDGHVLWSSRALEDNGPTAPIYLDERVIFNTESCTLFVMNAKTGKKLWHKYLGDPTLAQPAVDAGLIIAHHPSMNSGQPELTAYRIKDGSDAWTHATDGEPLAAPVIADGSVYVSTIGGTTYRFALKSGKRLWAKKLRATSAPWIVDGELYLARREKGKEVQVVVDADTGAVVRTHRAVEGKYLADVPANMNDWKKVWAYEGSRPALAGGVRYEAMGGVIQASDPRTGDAFWTRRYAAGEGKRSVGTVAVAGPQVVMATRDGQLFGLDVDTGYTLWAYSIGKDIVAQPIVAKGWVYASTTDGSVVALNVGDTSLDGWHMWGGNPQHNGPVAPAAPAPAAPAAKHATL